VVQKIQVGGVLVEKLQVFQELWPIQWEWEVQWRFGPDWWWVTRNSP